MTLDSRQHLLPAPKRDLALQLLAGHLLSECPLNALHSTCCSLPAVSNGKLLTHDLPAATGCAGLTHLPAYRLATMLLRTAVPSKLLSAHNSACFIWQQCGSCLQAGGSARGLGSQRLSGTVSGSHIPAGGKGMVLPFNPLDLTFHHLNYYVDLPKVSIPVT